MNASNLKLFLVVTLLICAASVAGCADDSASPTATVVGQGAELKLPNGVSIDQNEWADRQNITTLTDLQGSHKELSLTTVPREILESFDQVATLTDGRTIYLGDLEGDSDQPDCILFSQSDDLGFGLMLRWPQDPASDCGIIDDHLASLPEIVPPLAAANHDLQTSQQPLAYGTYLGSFNGVSAYANGSTSTVGSYDTWGLKYQCVHFVNTYFGLVYNFPSLKGGGNANNYFSTASAKGLSAFSNGSTTAPQVGDMIVSNGGTYGHIAIIREVGSNYVKIIQQNWFQDSRDLSVQLPMTVSGGRYTISNFSSSYPVKGWLRRADVTGPSVQITSPSSNANLYRGRSYTISWSASDASGVRDVGVGLISGNATSCYGNPTTLATILPAGQGYRSSKTWTVPSSLPAGSYKLKVAPLDNRTNWSCTMIPVTIR